MLKEEEDNERIKQELLFYLFCFPIIIFRLTMFLVRYLCGGENKYDKMGRSSKMLFLIKLIHFRRNTRY